MSYDKDYAAIPDYFGSEPEPLLGDWLPVLDADRPVLDIGAGQGRNTLFLARRGFDIVAIDPSEVGVRLINEAAACDGLPITALHCSFEDYVAAEGGFAAILAFGLLPVLTRPKIERLVECITQWTIAGSLVFVTGFTTDDEAFKTWSETGRPAGRNSFLGDEGVVRTFLEPGLILSLFEGFEPLHHWEGTGPSHRHGDGPVHRHALVEAVFVK